MTLGGLALAVGMLVDDATVEIENIHRNRLLGKPLTVAILDGARQVAVPALAATLTICIVFFPVVLLEGPARYLFVSLALAVVFSMIASYLLSRTLVPSLARRLLARQHGGESRFNRWRDRQFERLRGAHRSLLEACLARRRLFLVGGLAFSVASLLLVDIVGFDFFPSVDTGQMRLHVRAPVGTRIEKTEGIVAAVEGEIRRVIPAGELDMVNDMIGVPTFYNLAFVATDNVGEQDAEVLVQLKPKHRASQQYMTDIRRALRERFPDVQTYFMPADVVTQVLNFGVSSMIDVQIEGKDPEAIYGIARALAAQIRKVPGTEDVRINQVFDHPALRLVIDRQQALQRNIVFRDVASSVLTSLSSSQLSSPNFWVNPQNGVNYVVAAQTPIAQMASIDDLLGTAVTPAGGLVQASATAGAAASATTTPNPNPATSGTSTFGPSAVAAPVLGGIARLVPGQNRASINHYTVQPVVDVQASVHGRDLGGAAGEIKKIVDAVKSPAASRITIRGQAQSMRESFISFGLGLIVAIVLVYLLLVILFQSLRDPLIIMGAVVGAFVGIAWMLVVTGTTLNVESFMGAIMAIGIAVSNSILLVSFANQSRAEDANLSALDAALNAASTRLRPVLMTALAMILGMLPIALGLGEGGEQNAPLGRAVIGGLLMATVVTLLVVPTIYVILRRKPPTAHALDEQFARESRGATTAAVGF